MKFSLFRKPKHEAEPEKPTKSAEETKEETNVVSEESKQVVITNEQPLPMQEPKQEVVQTANKTYLKAMPLKELTDVETVKHEVENGNIIILRVTPLANKNIEDVKNAVNQLCEFTESLGGDIARLGEERVVVCPKNIRIWREKTPVSSEPLPTAA
jgi:SepF-like predicted cell division protein (DUF552 family)